MPDGDIKTRICSVADPMAEYVSSLANYEFFAKNIPYSVTAVETIQYLKSYIRDQICSTDLDVIYMVIWNRIMNNTRLCDTMLTEGAMERYRIFCQSGEMKLEKSVHAVCTFTFDLSRLAEEFKNTPVSHFRTFSVFTNNKGVAIKKASPLCEDEKAEAAIQYASVLEMRERVDRSRPTAASLQEPPPVILKYPTVFAGNSPVDESMIKMIYDNTVKRVNEGNSYASCKAYMETALTHLQTAATLLEMSEANVPDALHKEGVRIAIAKTNASISDMRKMIVTQLSNYNQYKQANSVSTSTQVEISDLSEDDLSLEGEYVPG